MVCCVVNLILMSHPKKDEVGFLVPSRILFYTTKKLFSAKRQREKNNRILTQEPYKKSVHRHLQRSNLIFFHLFLSVCVADCRKIRFGVTIKKLSPVFFLSWKSTMFFFFLVNRFEKDFCRERERERERV